MAMTPDEHPVVTGNENVAPLARYFLWVDTRKGVQKFIVGLLAIGAFLFAMDFVWHRHVKVPGEELYGFHAIVGFVSFTVIVLGAKMLRAFIRRDEDFYGSDGVDSEEYPEAGTQRLSHEQFDGDSIATLRAQILGDEPVADQTIGANDHKGGQAS